MRTFKSIERPAQVLGIDFQSLGLVVGVVFGGGMLLGVIGMAIHVPGPIYLLLVLVATGLFFVQKFLNKHRPPGYLMGFVSFRLNQPKRLTVGLPRNVQKQKRQANRS